MTLGMYIKDRLFQFAGIGIALAVVVTLMIIVSTPWWVIGVTVVLTALGGWVPAALDFKRRRDFYESVSEALVKARYPYTITEEMTVPQFFEGEALYETLDNSMKAVCDTLLIAQRADYSLQHIITSGIQDYASVFQQRSVAVAAKNLDHVVYTDDILLRHVIQTELSFALTHGREGSCLKFSALDSGGSVRFTTEFSGMDFDPDAQEILMVQKLCKALGITLSRMGDETTELTMEFPKKGHFKRRGFIS